MWCPKGHSQIKEFAKLVGANDQNSLYSWSVNNIEDFWSKCADYCGLSFQTEPVATLERGRHFFDSKWFPGSTLNYAEHLLRGPSSKTAIVELKENGTRVEKTFQALRKEVAGLQEALQKCGVQKNDRIAALVPNCSEAIVALLASSSLGAIWTSCSPDFGIEGVIDRFAQVEPKVFIAVDGYNYNSKKISTLEIVRAVKERIPSIEKVVIIPYLNETSEETAKLKENESWYPEFLTSAEDPTFEALPFDHPLYILYSSGTTGAPKCIVHSAGGSLIQHLKEHKLHTDINQDSKLFYFTTCGWMMWNWLVSALALDATVYLFDGSPFYPGPERLWEYADKEGITHFGTSAKYLAALQNVDFSTSKADIELQKLESILSTGSPLLPEQFDYVYSNIKADLCLSSISGGTDIVSCFALGNPALPVNRGELQTRGLGMKVEVWDETGEPVSNGCGELVCTEPFPSMPIGFWNDPDNSKYKQAYFDTYENIWHHGDWVELTKSGGMIFHGRSDAVLNPGGVRIGTAELYRQIEQLTEVEESLVVGQQWQGDERIVLFVKLNSSCDFTDEFVKAVKSKIRKELTPRHVPAKVIAVNAIPKTRSGKISELAVKNLIHGRPIKNSNALSNPECLKQFENLPELND